MNLVIFAIRLVLVVLSQSKSILENENEDAKHEATKLLKEILNNIATKVCDTSGLILNNKNKRQTEMQVRNFVFGMVFTLFVLALDPNC